MRAFALVCAGLLLLAGCSDGAVDPIDRDPPSTPDEGADIPEDEAMIEGTLAGDPGLEGGCAWISTPGGSYEVIWPSGYRVEFTPLRLIGPDDEVIAEEGDTVRVHGHVAEEMLSICQVGVIYQGDRVEAQ